MGRGPKRIIEYTGKAAKVNEKVLKLEEELRAAKAELKLAYKEQMKEEKAAERKAKKAAEIANKKAIREQKQLIWKMIEESGKSSDEILEMLKNQ